MALKKPSMIFCMMTVAAMAAPATAGAEGPECFGQPPTMIGTPGNDVLIGEENTADVIMGLGGNDLIRGSSDINGVTAPGDRLCGGSGNDYIRGGVGEDRIQGGRNADDVDGSFGYDVITQGGPGSDSVEDCDSEYTGGVRQIRGGPGDDYLCVDVDRFRMYGERGNDELVDLTCSSEGEMFGGPGTDHLESYFGNQEGENCSNFDTRDVVSGGPGVDSSIVSPNDKTISMESTQVQ